MSLIKFRTPFLELSSLFDDLESIGTFKTSYLPAADVIENENDFEISLSVPGYNKADFNIKLDKNTLIISGDKKTIEKKYNIRESFSGKFLRSFNLPKEIKLEEITATYIDGILTIKIPKDTLAIQTKVIEIQ